LRQKRPKFFPAFVPGVDPLPAFQEPGRTDYGLPMPDLEEEPWEVDGIMVSFSYLEKRAPLFRKVARESGIQLPFTVGKQLTPPVYLDSGAFQGKQYNQYQLLQKQAKYKPNAVFHMDIMGDCDASLKNAKIAKRHEKEFKFPIYYVLQGKTPEDYIRCAKEYKKLGVSRYAIGNLARRHLSPDKIRNLVRDIRSVIGKKPNLHLLGVSDLTVLPAVWGEITSFDSSTHARSATVRSGVLIYDRTNHILHDFRNLQYLPNPRKFVKNEYLTPVSESFDLLQGHETELPLGTGQRQRVRRLKSLHNIATIQAVLDDLERGHSIQTRVTMGRKPLEGNRKLIEFIESPTKKITKEKRSRILPISQAAPYCRVCSYKSYVGDMTPDEREIVSPEFELKSDSEYFCQEFEIMRSPGDVCLSEGPELERRRQKIRKREKKKKTR